MKNNSCRKLFLICAFFLIGVSGFSQTGETGRPPGELGLYVDRDRDTYGGNELWDGISDDWTSAVNTDCDDDDPTVHGPKYWYYDNDGDGFGNSAVRTATELCYAPSADYVDRGGDCSDYDVFSYPRPLYVDSDHDGFGGPVLFNGGLLSCGPENYWAVFNSDDCDDNDPLINPNTKWYLDDGSGFVPDADSSLPFIQQCLSPGSNYVSASTSKFNWIHDVSYDINGNVNGSSRVYFDDLGKSNLTLSKDFVANKMWGAEITYDTFGRVDKSSFPTISSLNNFNKVGLISTGSDYPSTAADLTTYYSNNNTNEPYQATATHPYSQTNYDVLNPGNVLSVVGGNQISGQWKTGFSYTMPAAQEMYYAFGKNYYDGPIVTQGEEVITKFYKTVMIDANGVETVAFTDGEGRTLATGRSGSGAQYPVVSLIGTQGYVDVHIPAGTTGATLMGLNPTADYRIYDLRTGAGPITYTGSLAPGNVYRIEAVVIPTTDPKTYVTTAGGVTYDAGSKGVTYNVNYSDFALNYYNSVGQVQLSVQPKGYPNNTTILASPNIGVRTGYEYNTLGQVVSVYTPDTGYAYFAYRKDGQIRFSISEKQDNDIRMPSYYTPFSYTDYDSYGRPIESGVCVGDFYSADPDALLDTNFARSEVTMTIYDDPTNYAGISATPPQLSTVLTGAGLPAANYIQTNLSGNVAITHTFNPSNSTTWYSYDIYGRVEWTVQNISGLGVKTIHYYYDANGNVKKVMYQKDVASELFVHRYTYDVKGALLTAEISTDNSVFKKQADYQYYLDGKLKRVVLANGLQGTDYVYTLGGALKSINHPSLDPAKDPGHDSNDVFGLTIDYYSGDYLRSDTFMSTSSTASNLDNYDGNIKAVRFANKSLDVPNPNALVSSSNMASQKGYLYSYNNNKWLTSAVYGNVNASYDFGSETATISPLTKYKESNLTYDANGNIMSLQRTNEAGTVVDNLTYNYYMYNPPLTGNQLSSVSDGIVGNAVGEYDLSSGQATNNYKYDLSGNLEINVKENLKYEYNTTGLITQVSVYTTSNPIVKFYYNEIGQRVKKESFNRAVNNQLLSTDYYVSDASGNTIAVYTKPASSSIALNELPIYGASRLGVYSKTDGVESYELTDHLGNVRAVIKKPDPFANPFSIMKAYADYYAFGEQLPSRNSLNNNYRYAFQGQEKDGDTGMEAFQLRLWDGRIGRWLSPDPKGQYFSPYLGMGNNPISRIDPDGGSDYPDRDGFGCGESWVDADGSWIWDSDIHQWVGQDGYSAPVLSNIWIDKNPPMISEYKPNFFGIIENLLQFKNAKAFPNSSLGFVAIFMGKMAYSTFDNAVVYGSRNFHTDPNMARHLNGFQASKEEVVEAGISTVQLVMPTPIKGSLAIKEATIPFVPKYNVATFGTRFAGTFVTKLEPATRGFLIRNINSKLINMTSRAGIISLTKTGSKNINKMVEN